MNLKVLKQKIRKNQSDLVTFHTSSSKFLFITCCAIDLLFSGDETLSSDRSLANATAKALFMPLTSLVFHFLCSWNKQKKKKMKKNL